MRRLLRSACNSLVLSILGPAFDEDIRLARLPVRFDQRLWEDVSSLATGANESTRSISSCFL